MTTPLPDDPLFLGPEFDLSLQLGPAGDDGRVAAAAEAVWASPTVTGPWSVSSRIGKGRPLYPDPSERGRRLNKSRFGLLSVDEKAGCVLPFVLHLIRDHSDWLTLGIPVAVLRSRYPMGYTWTVADQPWLAPLSRALADIADHIHRHTAILTGSIGEETSGCWRSPSFEVGEEACPAYAPLAAISANVIEQRGGFVVPPALWKQLAPKADSIVLLSGLHYVPPRPDAALTGA